MQKCKNCSHLPSYPPDKHKSSDDVYWTKINAFPGLITEHFYVKFGDLSCISF